MAAFLLFFALPEYGNFESATIIENPSMAVIIVFKLSILIESRFGDFRDKICHSSSNNNFSLVFSKALRSDKRPNRIANSRY
jgi:hypothetical protein